MNIPLKTPDEINLMHEGGKILAEILHQTLAKATPGITTYELDKFTDRLIHQAGAKPSFKMEKYSFATCLCVNDTVVHGVPDGYVLHEGDILGIDMGVFYKGFHTDASWTKEIASSQAPRNDNPFLRTGELALKEAIKVCQIGNHVGHISQKIQEIIEDGGYSCVKQLVGHGVGKDLHEDPEIPCYLRGKIENTAEIKEGMTFAVEIIYNMGKSPVIYKNDDGWTVVTRDGLPSGLFEHTIAVTSCGPEILTQNAKNPDVPI